MKRDQRMWLAIVAVGIAAVIILAFLIAVEPEPAVPDPVPVATPGPASPAAAPPSVRVPLVRPADLPPLEIPPEERPAATLVTADDRRAMNFAVDDVLTEAREDCILPWIDTIADPLEAEFVFDAVIYDGHLYDVGIRSLTLDMPAEVSDCIGDKAWYGDWPTWDLDGEIRMQRSISYANAASAR